ncbi:CocE/NonD family hydrolase [Chloroflexus aggregans]|uniref:CocE/NonD family hydrolase n=1 Tax=Chloroflexus aggregans TaxID=152260 RepID=UPI000A0055D2|nr:CocE/NonD family hydrolase [Chloroflexus aggregans]
MTKELRTQPPVIASAASKLPTSRWRWPARAITMGVAQFVNEAADGRATVAWIAEQPWFEGNLGLWGPSYVWYIQWWPSIDGPSRG